MRGKFLSFGAFSLPTFFVFAVTSAQASANSYFLEPSAVEKYSLRQFCTEVDKVYKRQKWGKPSICDKIPLQFMGESLEGRPLTYFETGQPKSTKLTLIQCGIHGDELPSLAMCMNLIDEILQGKKKVPAETRLIVQPLLNPDGMFRAKAQRPNARGVDINRNFATRDWIASAQEAWRKRDKADQRKFPGFKPNSEPETQAIAEFIEREKPQKIISIHTPLGFLDLDSAGLGAQQARRAKYLAINMSKNSGNYEFKSFGFFPGSMGNWAGRERQIPVYTLELPGGDSARTIDAYWSRFRTALWRAIEYDLETGEFRED